MLKTALTLITKISSIFLSMVGHFCSKTSLSHFRCGLFASVRFGTETNFDQHSDANNGAIGENITKRFPRACSYCELYFTICFGNF